MTLIIFNIYEQIYQSRDLAYRVLIKVIEILNRKDIEVLTEMMRCPRESP
jgi:hypothetical protein